MKETAYTSVLNESLWALLDDPRPAVRRAAYSLVSACCRHAPDLLRRPPPPAAAAAAAANAAKASLLEPASAGVEDEKAATPGGGDAGGKGTKRERVGSGGKRSRVATPALLVGLLSEREASNHREAWQAALLVLREFKETWTAEKGATVS